MSQVLKIWCITLFIKLVVTLFLPLSADETYYWAWSFNLQLGYYDHPPLIAWLIALGRKFEIISPNSIKFPSIILGHLSLLIWTKIYREISSRSTSSNLELFSFGILYLFSPLLGFGSLILTPDLPLVFFWSLSLLFTIRYFKTPRLIDALGIGLSLGLGFLSKYHIVLFIPPLLLWIHFEKRWRQIRPLDCLMAIAIGLISAGPVIFWNFQNDFISFKFQLNHGLGREDYKLFWTWSFLVGQIILISPPILMAIVRSQFVGIRRILLYFGFFPLLFFTLTSFRGLVEANWPIIAYPSLFMLAAVSNLKKMWIQIFAGFWSIVYILLIALSFKEMPSPSLDKFTELSRMKTITKEIESLEPLYFDTYQTASIYSWIRQRAYCKLAGSSRVDYYDFQPECRPKSPQFYYFANKETSPPSWVIDDPLFKYEIVINLETGDRVFKIVRSE